MMLVKSKLNIFVLNAATVCLLVLGYNFSTVIAQEAPKIPDSRSVLVEAVQAIKGLKSVSYDATYEDAFPGGKTLFIKGRAEVERGGVSDKTLPGKIYIKSEGYGGAQEISFDGKIARRLDHNKKTLTEGIATNGGVAVALTAATTLLHWNLIWDEPLKYESAATAAEYIGQASVGGVLCHVVDLKYSVPGTDISGGRWWFAVGDKLPRMFQTIKNSDNGKAVSELRITNLQIEKGISETKFKLELPGGYAYRTFTPSKANAKLIPVGSLAPDWTLPDKAGQQHRLSEFRGKIVVLEFWATWCGYCKISIPAMQRIHEKFVAKGVKVLGVNFLDIDGADPDAYLKSKGAAYSTLLNGEKIAGAYGVTSVPVFLVVNREGKVVFAAPQYSPDVEGQLEEAIKKALGEKTSTPNASLANENKP